MTGVGRQLYMGDCVEWMRLVPEGSVDLVVTDPPYLLKGTQGGGAFGSKGREYRDAVSDTDTLPVPEYINSWTLRSFRRA